MRPVTISPRAFLVAASLFAFLLPLSAPAAFGQEARPGQPPCSCANPQQAPRASPRPKFADHSPGLDGSDEIATLEAIRVALTQVGDGSTYVWHRDNGRLSGMVRPTTSFKDAAGRICRHIVLVLNTSARSGRVEGVACRLADGRWQLEG